MLRHNNVSLVCNSDEASYDDRLSVVMCNLTEEHAVRLLIHVPCKPLHFIFFQLFETTIFNRVLKEWPNKYRVCAHIQGRVHDYLNTRCHCLLGL